MEQVIISPEADRVIRDECAKHPNEETGGILIGRESSTSGIAAEILAATGPGPRATHERARFSPNVDWINDELKRIMQTLPGADYDGTYHQHLSDEAIPSGQDLKQGLEIVNDPEYKHNVFVGIITCNNPDRTRAYLVRKGDVKFKEARLVMAAPDIAPASAQSDAIAADIAQLESSGWITEQRRAKDGSLVLNVRQPGSNVVRSFLVPADYPRSRPAILVQMQTPWPEGSRDLSSAAARLLASDALARSRELAHLVDVLRRRGLQAQALWQSEDAVTFALRYRGLGTSGFMVVPRHVGTPAIYGADMQLRNLQVAMGLDAWAGDVRRALVVEHIQPVDRRLRAAAGVAAIGIGLTGLLHELGVPRDIVASLLSRFGR